MSEGYDFFLNRVLESLGPVTAQEGGSGYFSTPSDHLDPRLFSSDEKFIPAVRTWILNTLYSYWGRHFRAPQKWSTVWVAGSGISYQWAADRSNGDLDVLIGVDFPEFYRHNSEYLGLSESDVADLFNHAFKEQLWPTTAQTVFSSPHEDIPGAFEVTFYVNPNSADIRDIKPYAAYNLTADEWTVRPPELPENPESLYPKEYRDYVTDERRMADSLVQHYDHQATVLKGQQPGSPGWHNTMHAMGLVVDQARALFDDIHLGRKQAFGPEGSGYGDFYNYRWQSHKRAGTVQALNAIAGARREAREQYETKLYGAPIQTAAQALQTAGLWNRGLR